MKRVLLSLGLVSLTVLLLTGCVSKQETEMESASATPVQEEVVLPEENLVEVARAAGSFNTLLTAVETAGLSEALATGEYTVFAPSDEAFTKLPAGALDRLLADPEALANVLKYHLLDGRVMANEVVLINVAATSNGGQVTFSASESGAKINDANIVATDILAKNGVIHVIDSVLMPE